MGEFSQNLLKLTEFPFSYSLIGLLALIFGQGSGVGELNPTKMGPFLILMGFVATTLSICDPVGAVQRKLIKGTNLEFRWRDKGGIREAMPQKIFRLRLQYYFDDDGSLMISMLGSPTDLKKRYAKCSWSLISHILDPKKHDSDIKISNEDKQKLIKDIKFDYQNIFNVLQDMKRSTVKTKWITAEIDRINALIYFIVIISLFIVAVLVYPVFFQHFTQFFTQPEVAKLVILIFSSFALAGIIIAFGLKIKGLNNKASTVFKYLLALETIKTAKETFKVTLQDIERYLNDNDWTLAKYWVERILFEYREIFMQEVYEPTNTH